MGNGALALWPQATAPILDSTPRDLPPRTANVPRYPKGCRPAITIHHAIAGDPHTLRVAAPIADRGRLKQRSGVGGRCVLS